MRPCNRYILIKPTQEEEDKSVVLVPEDYRPKTNPHTVAEVLDWSDDVKLQLYENMKVVVNTSMIEEVSVSGKTHHLVLENYVLAVDE
tara:strand:- start:839 stop:1102 length:264 start_codon:yes stop_codon:yes gene_type:complete